MGYNYFGMIEDLYCSKISFFKPIVIRFDAENITKNKEFNILDVSIGDFAYALINTARVLSETYKTYVFCSTDEIDLIFINDTFLHKRFKNRKTQRISSIMSQMLSEVFHSFYKKNKIYFDAKTFNIPMEKVYSYIEYRQKSAFCVNTTYLAKRNLRKSDYVNIPLSMITQKLNEYVPYINKDYQYFQKGILYLNGHLIQLDDYLAKNQIMIID